MTEPREYDDGSVDRPLFDLKDLAGKRSEERGVQAPTAGWGICPACATQSGADQEKAIKAAGRHLRWSSHQITTVFGLTRPCPGSGQALCEAPPADGRVTWRLSARQRATGAATHTAWRCRCGRQAPR